MFRSSLSTHSAVSLRLVPSTHRPAGIRGRGSTSLPSSAGGVAGAWLPRGLRNSVGEAIGGRRGQEIKGAATGRRLGCQRGGGRRSQGGDELGHAAAGEAAGGPWRRRWRVELYRATTSEGANTMGLEKELGLAGEREWSWIGR
jgi:hypothetical protein